jgi:hypothetical protein
MKKFYRLSETINKKEDKRVVSVTIKPLLTDMSGTVWITDLMLQEGDRVTGFHPHTETMLQKEREGETIKEPVWYNGIVRGEETLILFNLGKTSTGLDLKLYPKSDMEGITISQAAGGQRAYFPDALQKDDELSFSASERSTTKNGQPFQKEGFYSYSAAWDSKHNVELPQGKSARVLFTLQEMDEGGELF